MVGLQDSINAVRSSIRDHDLAQHSHEQTQREHERILDDYDRMTRDRARRIRSERRHGHEHEDPGRSSERSKSPPSARFRFKTGTKSSGSSNGDRHKSKHRSRRHGRSHRHRDEAGNEADVDQYTAHPFTRPRHSEYLDPSISQSPQPDNADKGFVGPDDAFKQSLFDAIADDEGAAYWEGVYSQPIHVYPRPSVRNEQGHLEAMTDDQYVDYVKAKMFEKKHPHIVKEQREREEKNRQEGETRKRKTQSDDHPDEEDYYEWVGNEEKGYERRYAGKRRRPEPTSGDTHRNNDFMNDIDAALARGAKRKQAKRWQQAWSSYQETWQRLLKNRSELLRGDEFVNLISWPVLSLEIQDVTKENVQDFFNNATPATDETRSKMLKSQRVQWHPDKIQQLGGDNVDTDTLKLATLVFQVLDDLFSQERSTKE